MKFLFDFFPLLAFFVAFYLPEDREQGIYLATMTIMVATFIQITAYWLLYRKFEKMHLITFAVVLVFGALTIYLKDERFIKWKPTIVNWCFALAFIGSHFIGDKTLIQRIINMGENRLVLPAQVWRRINISWACFFVFLGCVNLYVAYRFSTEFWVNFKAWGMTLINIIFLAGVFVYIYLYIRQAEEAKNKAED